MTIIDFESRKRELEKKYSVEDFLQQAMNEETAEKFKLNNLSCDYDDVYELKLELVGSNLQDDNMLDAEQKEALTKYGKVTESLSRKVLVSGYTALWQLHYIIQQAFGWSNSHLHKFALKDDEFKYFTKGNVKNWADLCGIVLRFPDGDNEDLYWHSQDYYRYNTLKSWYRSKYNKPQSYLAEGDHYLNNIKNIQDLYAKVPVLTTSKGTTVKTSKARLQDLLHKVTFGADLNALLSRLEVFEIFTVPTEIPDHKQWLRDTLEYLDLDTKEGLAELAEIDAKVAKAQELMDKYFDGKGDFKDDLPVKKEREILETIWEAHTAEEEYGFLMYGYNPELEPFTDSIIYSYDYGDGWQVKITCENIYTINIAEDEASIPVFTDILGALVPAEISSEVSAVSRTQKPVCIASDGVNVVDDIGGLSGFCDFLADLRGKDKDTAAAAREWAETQEWTGRLRKPKNIL